MTDNSEDYTTEIPQVNLFNTPRFNESVEQTGDWFKDPENLFVEELNVAPLEARLIEDTNVNHPAYYNQGGIEVIDFIEAYTLPYHLGNAVKYIARAGLKDPDTYLEDLKKAKWYLEREINRYG